LQAGTRSALNRARLPYATGRLTVYTGTVMQPNSLLRIIVPPIGTITGMESDRVMCMEHIETCYTIRNTFKLYIDNFQD